MSTNTTIARSHANVAREAMDALVSAEAIDAPWPAIVSALLLAVERLADDCEGLQRVLDSRTAHLV